VLSARPSPLLDSVVGVGALFGQKEKGGDIMKRIVLLAVVVVLTLLIVAGTALAAPPPGSFGECNKNLAEGHKNLKCQRLPPI
jgi:hypothetical protein